MVGDFDHALKSPVNATALRRNANANAAAAGNRPNDATILTTSATIRIITKIGPPRIRTTGKGIERATPTTPTTTARCSKPGTRNGGKQKLQKWMRQAYFLHYLQDDTG